ncbi:MAG: copper resistance protein B [Gammaproteobacteria bacterium]
MFLRILCAVSLAAAPAAVSAREKELIVYGAQLEELEYRHELLAWDGDAFVGNDNIKLRWISEGEYDTRAGAFESMENRLVAQIPVSMFFDVKAGGRLDYYGGGADRWYAVLGASGLAPQWFEIDADLFLSETGATSARLDAEYELLLTNRLFFVASAESTYTFAADRKAKSGSRLNNLELGLRLHYDLIDRNVSPYFGAVYEKQYGDTAAMARDEGESEEQWVFVAGVGLRL